MAKSIIINSSSTEEGDGSSDDSTMLICKEEDDDGAVDDATLVSQVIKRKSKYKYLMDMEELSVTRVIVVEDADFPLELEKVVIRSLLVANAGDCRAVLSRLGVAVELSKDHRPCCMRERKRIESLGGYVDDGYLNGQLGVTRAIGDWHLEGMKEAGQPGGPLSAEPELKMTTLTKEDEFLIIGSDGIWDVFSNQNVVDFARRRLQEHNDVKLCCKELVEEALKRGAIDNLTAVVVCFHSDSPPQVMVQRARVRRSISAEGLQSLKCLLGG